MEPKGYDRMKAFYKARENSLRAKIADLKDKVRDFGLRNNYLDSKVLKLEDRIERQRMDLRGLCEKEKQCVGLDIEPTVIFLSFFRNWYNLIHHYFLYYLRPNFMTSLMSQA
jgi:hypothetical protein